MIFLSATNLVVSRNTCMEQSTPADFLASLDIYRLWRTCRK